LTADTLETYRHSGKFTLPGILLPLVVCALVAFPAGLAYGYLIRWIPIVYLNILLTLGYGFAFGWLARKLLQRGKVRNTALATAIGVISGLFALYGEWSGHVHAVFDDAPWLLRPDEIFSAMAYLYENGSWTLGRGSSSSAVTGIVLALVWAVEALLIVGLAGFVAWNFSAETPFCEKAGCWLDEKKHIDTLAPIAAEQLPALKSGSLQPLLDTAPCAEGADEFTRLTLKRAPVEAAFCTLRVEAVTRSYDKEGKMQEKVQSHTGDLILPASMFDLIAQFEELKPRPAPGPASPA